MVIEPNNSYRLIELESPDKIVETRKGHPRSELTQPAFQIAEWRHYILEHYDVIRGLYPGINVLPKTTIIIGRGRFESPTERKERDQIRITYDVTGKGPKGQPQEGGSSPSGDGQATRSAWRLLSLHVRLAPVVVEPVMMPTATAHGHRHEDAGLSSEGNCQEQYHDC